MTNPALQYQPEDPKQRGLLMALVCQIYSDVASERYSTEPDAYDIRGKLANAAGSRYYFESPDAKKNEAEDDDWGYGFRESPKRATTPKESIECPEWAQSVSLQQIDEIVKELRFKGFLPSDKLSLVTTESQRAGLSSSPQRRSSHRAPATVPIAVQNLENYDARYLTDIESDALGFSARKAAEWLKKNKLAITGSSLRNQINMKLGNPDHPEWMTRAWTDCVPNDLFNYWAGMLANQKKDEKINLGRGGWLLGEVYGRDVTEKELRTLSIAIKDIIADDDDFSWRGPSVTQIRSRLPSSPHLEGATKEWAQMVPGRLIEVIQDSAIFTPVRRIDGATEKPWRLHLPRKNSATQKAIIPEFGAAKL